MGEPKETSQQPRDQTAPIRGARHGNLLFAIYLLLYGGFVVLNAFKPSVMESVPFAGVNLAILSGMGLIAAAFLMALLYAWLCRGGSR